jgi:hypothetical protein
MTLSSLADVADAVKAGVLGLIEVISIGDLTVSALKGLSGSDSLTITRRPVQAGYDIVRAAVRNPKVRTLTILLADPEYSAQAGIEAAMSGSLAGLTDTWRDKRSELELMHTNKEIVPYQTHENVYPPSLVQEINALWDVEDNQDAFIANVTMVEIPQVAVAVGTGLIDSPFSDFGIA